MNRLFSTDDQRERAAEVRRLMMRVESETGEGRKLGADIVAAIGAPATIGNVVGCIDCAWHLASFLELAPATVHDMVVRDLASKVQRGWKRVDDVTSVDVARAFTLMLLRVQLARLERAPA